MAILQCVGCATWVSSEQSFCRTCGTRWVPWVQRSGLSISGVVNDNCRGGVWQRKREAIANRAEGLKLTSMAWG